MRVRALYWRPAARRGGGVWRTVCFYRCTYPVRMRKSSVFLNMSIKMRTIYSIIPYFDFSKMTSKQALPGPSTSGGSSPSESPWQVQHKEKVISLCLARFPQLFASWCSANKQSLA